MKREDRLDKELQFHLDRHIADLIADGHSPADARRLARIALGGPEQVKEACRDVRSTRWLEDFFQDFRYALRGMRRRPGFSAIALLTLGLGVGAATLLFTIIEGVLLKPFPYAHPERLLNIQEQTDWSTQSGNIWALTYPNLLDCKRGAASFEMAAFFYSGGIVSGGSGNPEYADAFEISSNLFSVLGVPLLKGRAFLPDEDRPGGPPVAIISYGLWQRRFAANPSGLGATFTFGGRPYTIVGITSPGFRIADQEIDVFTPIGQDPSPLLQNREAHGLGGWARLLPAATLAQANAELAVVGRRLAEQYPKSNKGRTFVAEPLSPNGGDVRSTLWLLFGAATILLLVACANIASLLLARAVSRERELAMRIALGARRGRLIRQCLTESATLGLAGGAIGVVLAATGLHPFIILWPGRLPREEEVQLDWRVLLFAFGAALVCGLIFGIAPAWRASARDLEQRFRAGARTVVGSTRRLHATFVAGQIGLAMVLLVSAGMLAQTMRRLSALDPGVDVHNVLTARAALSPATLADPARTRTAWQEILNSGSHVQGVRAIALVDTVPMRAGDNQVPYSISAAVSPDNRQPFVLANSTTPGYLRVMGIPLLRGRFFTDQDGMGSEPVAVIDDVMAHQAFPGQDPLGKRIWVRIALGRGGGPLTVIGIVGHVRQWGLAGDDSARVRAQLYYPWAQLNDVLVRRWSELMSIAVRTDVDPLTVVEPLRREVRGSTNDQVLYEVRTLEQLAAASLARQRFLLLLFAVFAALALLLASIGIYGVLAYLTGLRVPEIGVRMALGAGAGQVMWMVLRQSLTIVLYGVIAGAAGAAIAAQLLLRLVTGMQPADPWTFAGMIAVLILAALVASFLPARRASRIDPVGALRQE